MRWFLFALLVVHAFIHGTGVVEAFGAGSTGPSTQVSLGTGLLWLAAGLTLLIAAALVFVSPSRWWIAGALGVALSQAAISTAWTDAKYGSLVNVLLVLFLIHAFAAEGPFSLRAGYRRAVERRLPAPAAAGRVTEADLDPLPEQLRRYLRLSGALGRPRVRSFSVETRGRIRGSASEPWMSFTSMQWNFVAEPSRFFLMRARRGRLPVDVFHAFQHGSASMRVRLLSLVPMVSQSGAELTRSETVTLFNDMCVFAPAALIDAPVRWETLDPRMVRGHYTVGANTIAADLSFDADGRLVDFVSGDRSEATDGGRGFVRRPWSTPLKDYEDFGATTIASRGEGRWLPADGEPFTYIELEVTDVTLNGGS